MYKNTCFWLFVPVIVFNMILTKYLPEYYLQNIKHPIVIAETIARILTIAFSIIMSMKPDNKPGKAGIFIYVIGVIIYFCSYVIVIKIPAASFNYNLAIMLAPYWTSILWLVGIGLLGNTLFMHIPYHFSVYIAISFTFTVIHSFHGFLCCKNGARF